MEVKQKRIRKMLASREFDNEENDYCVWRSTEHAQSDKISPGYFL